MTSITTHRSQKTQGGFTLVELLITIGIIILVTGLVLARYSAFDGTVLLKNQAYDIALDLRQTQSYGLGSNVGGDNFRDPYGIYFSILPGKNQQYIIFQDSDDNGSYDSGEEIATQPMRDRFIISSLSNGQSMSVTFKRPNFDARIDGTPGTATVTVSNPASGFSRVIEIGAGGNIAVKSGS